MPCIWTRGSLRGYDNVIKVQRLDIFTHSSQDPYLYSVTIEVEKTLKQSNDIYLNSDSKIVLEEGWPDGAATYGGVALV